MRKIIILSTCFLSAFIYSQCNITGKSTIKENETEVYSVDHELAQCKECHAWTAIGQPLAFEGDQRLSSIKVNGNHGGKSVLAVSILTSKGMQQCSKEIEIIPIAKDNINAAMLPSDDNRESSCNIKVNTFYEHKISEGVAIFFPNYLERSYSIAWSARYENGEERKSSDLIASFPYSKQNGIVSLKIQIEGPSCMKRFTKSYDKGYWVYF